MTLYERVHGTAPGRGAATRGPGHPAPATPAASELRDGAYPARGVASARYTFGTPTRTRQDHAPMG